MTGRLTATVVDPGGTTQIAPPRPGEDLFLYVTDGAGRAVYGDELTLGQYDVILARPDMETATVKADPDAAVHFLSFYLPTFLK